MCVGEYYTADKAVSRHTKQDRQLRVSCSLTHWGQSFRMRHLLLSKLYMSVRSQNKWEYFPFNDINQVELSVVIMLVPVLLDKSKKMSMYQVH